jgi:hypothetical protein
MRRCWNSQQIERFHEEIILAVQEESPATADRILMKLEAISSEWAANRGMH